MAKTVKTGSFICNSLSEKKKDYTGTWEVRRKASRKKDAVPVDTESIVATLEVNSPDEFNVSDMTLQFNEQLTKEEYHEILAGILSYIPYSKDVDFFRISKSTVKRGSTLAEALEKYGFEEDPTDDKYLIFEGSPTNWTVIYMLLGMAIGTSIGVMMNNQALFGCIGLVLGLAVGTALNSNEKKRIEELKNKRKGRLVKSLKSDKQA